MDLGAVGIVIGAISLAYVRVTKARSDAKIAEMQASASIRQCEIDERRRWVDEQVKSIKGEMANLEQAHQACEQRDLISQRRIKHLEELLGTKAPA